MCVLLSLVIFCFVVWLVKNLFWLIWSFMFNRNVLFDLELIEIIGIFVLIVCLIDGLRVFVFGNEMISFLIWWFIVVLINVVIFVML